MPWVVAVHPATEKELEALPVPERRAVQHAIEKLENFGPSLGHPHSSAVRNAVRQYRCVSTGGEVVAEQEFDFKIE